MAGTTGDTFLERAPTSVSSVRSTRLVPPAVEVIREGHAEPFLATRPTVSSAAVEWEGMALDDYTVPAIFIPRHEHPALFLHVVLSGSVRYEVKTKGRVLQFTAGPDTTFILPAGTNDEINWAGPTHRIAAAVNSRFLNKALEETAHQGDTELTEHWNLTDRHISALLVEMAADLREGSPAGRLYGESLANALAVYLLQRYAVWPCKPVAFKGGLPRNRLQRVLDYMGDNISENVSLSQLAAIADMSPHYFSELFKQTTGRTPHKYFLLQRLERAKQQLRDPKRSIIEAALAAGFQNPSHFARIFRKVEGTTPSKYRAIMSWG